jgi:hypothetical protein
MGLTKVHVEVGAQFGLLTVVELTRDLKKRFPTRIAICKCECGGSTTATLWDLVHERRVSCGCRKGQWHRGKMAKGWKPGSSYNQAKKDAKTRGLDFVLNKTDYSAICANPCHYCGADATGLDRINPNVHYLLHNVVPACYVCNKAKSIMSVEEFADWVMKLHTHMLATNWEQQYVVPTQRLFGD